MTETLEKLDPKTDGSSMDMVQSLIDQLRPIVPEAFTEGKIDFDVLRELLGDDLDDRPERYSFNWHGKSRARRIAQTPSTGTLRPCPDESVNWDTTKNIFIEGDNLEVLKLLQKSYHKRVKMIYIDPPYNTGNEFIYPDKFQDNLDTYLKYTGQVDGDGLKISANAETGGRYHTNWLNMMYPRLKMARNLLRDDGVIFVSIDDNEVQNLRNLMDEIFGPENFIATVIWQKVFAPKNSAKHFSEDHDYVIVFARNANSWSPRPLPRTAEQDALYQNRDDDPRGPWMSDNLTARNYYGEGTYSVVSPTGNVTEGPPQGRYWGVSKEKFDSLNADNRIWWGEDGNNMPRLKRFLSEVSSGRVPQTLWPYKEVGHTQEAKKELLEFVSFEKTENVLNSVKPTRLIQRMLQIATAPETTDIVLDFFAGSASTAHAVIKQNREDGGNRRFIMVQLPEPLPKQEAHLKTIADLGKTRIKHVIDELDDEDLTLGFRLFTLSSTNIVPWSANHNNLDSVLLSSISNIRSDRSPHDVLFELLLKFGLEPTTSVEQRECGKGRLFIVGSGALVLCLADDISLEVVESIADLKNEYHPELMRIVFKDSSFADDVSKTNAIQILRQRGIEDVKSL